MVFQELRIDLIRTSPPLKTFGFETSSTHDCMPGDRIVIACSLLL